MLKRYAAPLAKNRTALRRPRSGARSPSGVSKTGFWRATTERFRRRSPPFVATLAYDCRRAERYRAELIDALMLVQRGVVRPNQLRGAWAGANSVRRSSMPSAYLMFATTPDGGGSPDLIHNSTDALASTANFLQGHGWQRGAELGRRRKPNFAAIRSNGTARRSTPRPWRCFPTGLQGDRRAS